jgi:hypothetical protein
VPRPNTTRRRVLHGTAAALAALLVASSVTSCTEPPNDGVPRAQVPEVSDAKIKQARWQITTERVGSVAKVTRADKKRLKAQRPRLTGLVKDVYDSLFLFPSRKKTILRKHFERPAARKVLSSRAGVSSRATRVHIWSRRAGIGIQPNSAAAAAANVYVRATGRVENKRFRLVHRATLWLQQLKRGWKVVGFDFAQAPLKREARDKEKGQEKRRQKRGSKKRRNA